MREITIAQLHPGMRLGQNIYSPDESIEIVKGTILTPAWIEKFRQWGRRSVSIDMSDQIEEELQNIEIMLEEIFSLPKIGEESLANSQTAEHHRKYTQTFLEAENDMRKYFLAARKGEKLFFRQLEEVALEKLMPLLDVPEVFLYLHKEDDSANYLYRHCMDVALLSGLIGRWLGLKREEIGHLVYAGLILDLGKAQVTSHIIAKAGKLTEEEMEQIQAHVKYISDMLTEEVSPEHPVAVGIRQHHERLDGSGYPRGLSGHSITLLGRILAIADIYDALTSNRAHKNAVTPLEALKIMQTEMAAGLDGGILKVFSDHLHQQMVGAFVVLSNGERVQIQSCSLQNQSKMFTVRRENGNLLDLQEDQDLYIAQVESL